MLCESVMVATILSPQKDNQYFIGCGTKDTCNPTDSSDTVIQSSLKELQSSDLSGSSIFRSGENYDARANPQARVDETRQVSGPHSGCSNYFDNMGVGEGIDCVELSAANDNVLGSTITENKTQNVCTMDDFCGIPPANTDGTDVLKEIDRFQETSHAESSHTDQTENSVFNACSDDSSSSENIIEKDFSDGLRKGGMMLIPNDQAEERNCVEEKTETLPEPQVTGMDVRPIDRNLGEKLSGVTARPSTHQCVTDQFSTDPPQTAAMPDKTSKMVSSEEVQNAEAEAAAKDDQEVLDVLCLQGNENEIGQKIASVAGNDITYLHYEENAKLACELQQSDLKIEERLSSEEKLPVVFHPKGEVSFSKSHNEVSFSMQEHQNLDEEPVIVNAIGVKGVQDYAEVSLAEAQDHTGQGLDVKVQDHTEGGSCSETQEAHAGSSIIRTSDSANPENISVESTSQPGEMVKFKPAHEIEEHRCLALSPRSSHIVEFSHSLRELLTSEDQLQARKEDRLPSTPPKIWRGAESSSYRSSATGSDGISNSHESLSFPHKWYEDADDDEGLSGPIAFSGALTHSGLICQVSHCGSVSHRSDSSASTQSFAFPILASDFSSSPVKRSSVPDARGRRLWRKFCRSCLCTCRHSSTLSD